MSAEDNKLGANEDKSKGGINNMNSGIMPRNFSSNILVVQECFIQSDEDIFRCLGKLP
jgi:hypothetical protein